MAAAPARTNARAKQKIRDLVAFGETPERWARGIEFMRDDLRDPQADTGRLVALHGQRHDLLPAVDAMDHALDYLDEVEAEGGPDSADALLNPDASLPASESDPGVRNAVYRPVPGQDPGYRLLPWIEPPEGAPEATVELRNTESGESGAPAQPASGSADGSPTDGPSPTGSGGQGQGSETPSPGLRPAPGINPRAGTAGQAQAGATVTQAVGTLDSALLPAEYVGDKSAAEFQARTGYGIKRSEGGLVLTDPSGNALFELPEDAAAELARSRDPDVIRRMDALGVLWREDIPPAEKRRLIEQEVYRDVPEALRGAPVAELDWTSMEGGDPTDFRLRAAASKLKAYDDLAAALESGASGEEVADRLGAFQAAMLPEAFGSERFLRELVKDVMPGLGNVRSIRHLQNDIAEIDRAIESGEWGDAAYASGMAILDTVGIFPGVNVVKGLVKGATKAIPRASSLLAERSIRRLARQWGDDVGTVDPKRFFGDALDVLPADLQRRVKGLVNNSVGRVSEDEVFELGKRMDPGARPHVVKELSEGQGFPTKSRRYDMDALLPSEVLAARSDTLGRVARWVADAGDEIGSASKAEVKQYEVKAGGGSRSADQRKVDQTFRDNPELAKDHDVKQIVDLRKAPDEVSIEAVTKDLTKQLDTWVSKGSLPRDQADALQLVMRQMQAKGIETIRLEDYAGLLARLGAAAPRRLNPDGGAITGGPMSMS